MTRPSQTGSGLDKVIEEEYSAFGELKKTVPESSDVREGRAGGTKVLQKDWLSMPSSYTNTMPTPTHCKYEYLYAWSVKGMTRKICLFEFLTKFHKS
jgi:hypothetical protein